VHISAGGAGNPDRGWIDGELIIDADITGRRAGLRPWAPVAMFVTPRTPSFRCIIPVSRGPVGRPKETNESSE